MPSKPTSPSVQGEDLLDVKPIEVPVENPVTVPEPESEPVVEKDTLIDTEIDELPPEYHPNWEKVNAVDTLAEDLQINSQVFIPSDLPENIERNFQGAINLKLKDNPKSVAWAKAVTEGMKVSTGDNRFLDTLKEGTWVKSLNVDSTSLSQGIQSVNHISNTRVSGKEAQARARIFMGGGNYYSIPCWSTGLWVTLNPISELDLLELYREITSSKIALGHYTYGAIFSSVSGYAIEAIVNFIVRNIGTTTFKQNIS